MFPTDRVLLLLLLLLLLRMLPKNAGRGWGARIYGWRCEFLFFNMLWFFESCLLYFASDVTYCYLSTKACFCSAVPAALCLEGGDIINAVILWNCNSATWVEQKKKQAHLWVIVHFWQFFPAFILLMSLLNSVLVIPSHFVKTTDIIRIA